MSQQLELLARDRVLDKLEKTYPRMIALAYEVSRELASRDGCVTSVKILDELRKCGYSDLIQSHDTRWMGCLFRKGMGWRRIGWENTGSHGRPVAIWTLREK